MQSPQKTYICFSFLLRRAGSQSAFAVRAYILTPRRRPLWATIFFYGKVAPRPRFLSFPRNIKTRNAKSKTRFNNTVRKKEVNIRNLNIEYYPYAIDCAALCQERGFAVFERELPRDVKSFCVIQSAPYQDFGVGKLIAANLALPYDERRVAIVAELVYAAQYPFQQDKPFYLHETLEPLSQWEKESRDGALRVLMPEEATRRAISDIEQFPQYVPAERDECLAAEFCLPVSDVRRRIKRLHL